MHAEILRELRMEGREQETAVADEDRLLAELPDHLDARSERADARRADEDAVQGQVVAREVDVGLEAPHLAPVGVPVDLEIREPEMVAVEHDHPGARPEDRPLEAANRRVEAVELCELDDRGGLAAWDDEPLEAVQILGLADLYDLDAEAAKCARVLPKGPLEREHADRERRVPGRKGWIRAAFGHFSEQAPTSPAPRAAPPPEASSRRSPPSAVRGRSRPRRGPLRPRSASLPPRSHVRGGRRPRPSPRAR